MEGSLIPGTLGPGPPAEPAQQVGTGRSGPALRTQKPPTLHWFGSAFNAAACVARLLPFNNNFPPGPLRGQLHETWPSP